MPFCIENPQANICFGTQFVNVLGISIPYKDKLLTFSTGIGH